MMLMKIQPVNFEKDNMGWSAHEFSCGRTRKMKNERITPEVVEKKTPERTCQPWDCGVGAEMRRDWY
jgi:hypothetical protein